MVAESRNRTLIVFALVLAAIKIIFLPWLDAQNEARQNLEVLTRRLERSVGVVQNRAVILQAEAALREATSKSFERFPTFPALDPMKLEVQVRVGEMAKTKGLRAGLFEWVLVGENKEAGLQFARLRIQVSGELRNLGLFQGELESTYPNMIVRDLRIESVLVNKFVEYGGEMTLAGDFYFKISAAP